jgi:hypothetical protein
MLAPSQPFPIEALSEDLCVFRLSKAERDEVGVIAVQGVCVRRRRYHTGSAKCHFTVFEAPHGSTTWCGQFR